MSSTLLQRHLGLPCRLVCRQSACVSTSSAINRGLRATRDDSPSSRGGGRDAPRRDRTTRPSFKDRRKLSEHVDVDSRPSRSGRDRGSFSGRDTATSRTSFRDRSNASQPPRTGRTGTISERRSSVNSSFRGNRSEVGGRSRPDRLNSRSVSRPTQGPQRSFDRAGDRPNRPGPRNVDHDRGSTSAPRQSRYSDLEDAPQRGRGFAGKASNDRKFSPTAGDQDNESSVHDGARSRPPEGLLKSIKKAIQAVTKMQHLEAEGGDPNELAPEARYALKNVNSLISTGTFREGEEPAEAVVSIFKSKAKPDTFLAGSLPDGKRSVIYVTQDGVIDLAVGKSRRGGRSAAESDRTDRRAERRSTQEPSSTVRTKPRRESDEDDEIPVAIPFTTPSSEFLYGYNSVLAALLGQRRTLYKLYVQPKMFEREVGGQGTYSGKKPASELVDLAKEAGIPFRNEFRTALLDGMSGGRPHNGVVLEASKLPAPPVLSLQKPEINKGLIPVTLGDQSKEDAKINGSPRTISALRKSWRYPLVVLLDGITDPGNVGNIIRTCHFYGVDAVAVATNTCANLSSGILAKASAGACEAMQILALPKPSSFVHDSSRYKWKVYAAVAPTDKADLAERFTTISKVSTASPLAKHPCILMLGAEGAGLRENLMNRADQYVSIESAPRADGVPDVGVDSMNVSTAAGVLLDAFMRKPTDALSSIASEELGF